MVHLRDQIQNAQRLITTNRYDIAGTAGVNSVNIPDLESLATDTQKWGNSIFTDRFEKEDQVLISRRREGELTEICQQSLTAIENSAKCENLIFARFCWTGA
jgi:hypothetical protein